MKTKDEIKAMFDEVSFYANGGRRVILDNKWFHVDEDGIPLYEERFEKVTGFDIHGIAIARLDNKEFHIGRDGKALYEERFRYVVTRFENGIAQVQDEHSQFAITEDGKRVYQEEVL